MRLILGNTAGFDLRTTKRVLVSSPHIHEGSGFIGKLVKQTGKVNSE